MKEAPKDGTLLLLLIANDNSREHPLEDSDKATITIGHNNFDNGDIDLWQFAGWCWSHDHYTEGIGNVIAWSKLGDFGRVTDGKHGP